MSGVSLPVPVGYCYVLTEVVLVLELGYIFINETCWYIEMCSSHLQLQLDMSAGNFSTDDPG